MRHARRSAVSVPPTALALAAVLTLGPGTLSLSAQQDEPADASIVYSVRPGDKIITNFFSGAGVRQEEIAGERIVDRAGRVYFPFLGSVDVRGMDAEDIRAELARRYAEFYTDPVIDVRVQLRVNVTGAVGRSGSYFLDPSSSLVDAIATAGGSGQELAVASVQVPSNPAEVRLVRDGERIILDMRADHITDEVLNMRIQSGDWLYVPPRDRSRIRDDITFWGSVISFVGSVAGLIILLSN